jgi:hypothetical protein
MLNMNNLNEFLHDVLPILLTIFILVFCLIILIRIIVTFLVNQAFKRYLKLKKLGKKIIPTSKKFIKEDEELFRSNIEIPRANSEIKAEIIAKRKTRQNRAEKDSYEIIESKEQQIAKTSMSKGQIVDFAKPIGFWTSLILGQKLTYLVQSAQVLNKRGDKGFWASMIEAKERSAGRQHGRSR